MKVVQVVWTLWGQRIRAARESHQITQVRLAAAMGVTQQVVSKWEHGISAPADDRRAVLARFLGLSVGQLFSYEPDCAPNGGEEVAA